MDVHFPAGVLDVDQGIGSRNTENRDFAEVWMHDIATHDDSKGQYFWVWGALLVLTAIEVVLAYKQVFAAVRMLEILLVLSVIKSALIIGYFMHLKFERALMRWLLVISVSACFVIMYFFFFPDADRIIDLGVK
jgi:caa(3)-type oxidase subunit IV